MIRKRNRIKTAASNQESAVTEPSKPTSAELAMEVDEMYDHSNLLGRNLPPATEESQELAILYGSDKQPSVVDIEGDLVPLGTLVAGAQRFSGLTAYAWNELPVEERETRIDDWIQEKRIEARTAAEAQPAEDSVTLAVHDGEGNAPVPILTTLGEAANDVAAIVQQLKAQGAEHITIYCRDPGQTEQRVVLHAALGECENPSAELAQLMAQYLPQVYGPSIDAASTASEATDQPVYTATATGRDLKSPPNHIDEANYSEGVIATDASQYATDTLTELPMANNEDIPALPGGFSPMVEGAVGAVISYIDGMRPKMPVPTEQRLRNQVGLYRAIVTIIDRADGEEFTRAWGWLLEQFSLYRKGVFGERYVYRDFENIPLSEGDRTTFRRLLTLLSHTCDRRAWPVVLTQMNIARTLETGITEAGRQRVLGYYGI